MLEFDKRNGSFGQPKSSHDLCTEIDPLSSKFSIQDSFIFILPIILLIRASDFQVFIPHCAWRFVISRLQNQYINCPSQQRTCHLFGEKRHTWQLMSKTVYIYIYTYIYPLSIYTRVPDHVRQLETMNIKCYLCSANALYKETTEKE